MARKVSFKVAERMNSMDWDYGDTKWSCKNRRIIERRELKKNKRKTLRRISKEIFRKELDEIIQNY